MELPIHLTGTVEHGEKVGRTIGFPTANLELKETPTDLRPGVYFGRCEIVGETGTYWCLPYFGPRTIFGETQPVFEVYIYNFDQQLYGKELKVTLLAFSRPPAPAELVNSLAKLATLLESDKQHGLMLQQQYP